MRSVTCVFLLGMALAPVAAHADKTSEAALDARVKALEQRVAELEAKLTAIAAKPATPAVTLVPHVAPAPGAPVPQARWQDPAKWNELRQGMAWSQVKDLLGTAEKVTTGVFGDVWYYPDDSGGRVIFDRDGRVAEWNAPSRR
jgi:hypothetical protein